jgi:hypothetical protein
MGENGEGCIYRSGHDAKITLMITMLGLILAILVGQAVWISAEIKDVSTRIAIIEYRDGISTKAVARK